MTSVHLDVAATGDGPAVVFTHGWLDERSVWDGVVELLANDARCLTWSLRGHGESATPPAGNYTRDHALGDLERVVADAEQPCVLVGHSLGGYLALAYALRHPDQVRALVLIAAGPGFRKEEARTQWNESVDATAAKLGTTPGVEEISKHVDSWVLDQLGDIDAPTLVIIGEHDKRFMASASVFEKYLDVQASVVVPDSGHSVHRKHAEPVAAAIKDFLAGLDD